MAAAATGAGGWSLSLGQFLASPTLQARLDRLPQLPLPLARALLYGPPRCGKTSLLFSYAFHLAAGGKQVVYLCDQACLDAAPPLLPQQAGGNHSHEALSRIHFKYVRDLHELRNYGACLHLLQQPPDAIIVDGLAGLTRNSKLPDKRAQDVALTKALAFLADALDQLKEQRGTDVLLLVSEAAGGDDAAPATMYLLQRWFPLVLCVSGSPGPGHVLTLQVAAQSRVAAGGAARSGGVRYIVTQSYLHADSVLLP